jgi:hypothetical protein
MSTHRLTLSPRALVLYALALLLILTILATAQTSASSTGERPAAASTPGGPSANMLQTPTPTCSFNTIISGAITGGEPTIPNPLLASGSPSTCAAPNSCPGAGAASPRHYDAFVRQNGTANEICYQVQVNASQCAGNLFVAAYSGPAFDPNSVCVNYLADVGVPPSPSGEFELRVPAGAQYTLVVYENAPNVGCPGYTLTLRNCSPPPTPTSTWTPVPTPTGTPPTPIVTSTGGFTPGPGTGTPSPTPTMTATPQTGVLLPAVFRNAFHP